MALFLPVLLAVAGAVLGAWAGSTIFDSTGWTLTLGLVGFVIGGALIGGGVVAGFVAGWIGREGVKAKDEVTGRDPHA